MPDTFHHPFDVQSQPFNRSVYDSGLTEAFPHIQRTEKIREENQHPNGMPFGENEEWARFGCDRWRD